MTPEIETAAREWVGASRAFVFKRNHPSSLPAKEAAIAVEKAHRKLWFLIAEWVEANPK